MNDSDSRALPPLPTSLCMRYQPLLALVRTDAVSPREAATLTEHIQGCHWCQRELATYDALDAVTRQHLSTVTFTPLTLEDIMQTPLTPTQTPANNAAPATPAPTHGEAQRTDRPRPSGRPPIPALASLAAVIALILLAGLIFTTHGPGPTPGSGTPEPPVPTATLPTVSQQTAALAKPIWTLTQLAVDGHEQPIVPSRAPKLHFQPHDDRSGVFWGTDGCNHISGSYTITDTSMRLTRSATTDMACQSIALQYAYVYALPRVEQFQLEGDTLTLTSADGSVRLTFHATH